MSDLSTVQLPPLPPGEEPPAELPPEAEPPGPGPRRRWLRIALIAVLAVLLVATPVTLYLILHDDSPGTGGVGGGGGVPTAEPTVSTAPSGAPSATSGVTAPDGRISPEVLRNATIDVPPWPTDNLTGISGRVTFHNGEVLVPADSTFPFERHMLIGNVTYGDVDRDGATETVVQISAFVQGGSIQIVALDRDRRGTIVTMGTVVATTGEVRGIDAAATRVTGDGVVEARVGDYQRCCGDETPQLWQKRGYAWNGSRFRQTTGPVSFPINPSVTETSYTPGELVLGPAVNGVRHGTLTVTVRYVRGVRPAHLALYMNLPPGMEPDGSAWPPVRSDQVWPIIVDVPTPATGADTTYTFAFRRPATSTGGDFGLDVRGVNAAGTVLSESNPWKSPASVVIRTSD
ncbi:hypothetical protein [Virgisporangium aurantiacum]|nr:hypothetical protein [Virgisporangium aurantiacum]